MIIIEMIFYSQSVLVVGHLAWNFLLNVNKNFLYFKYNTMFSQINK